MTVGNGSETPAPKLFGPVRVKMTIAAACAGALLLGVLTLPAPAPSAVAPSQERPVPLLEAEVERREQLRLFRELQDLAPRLARHSVTIPLPEGVVPLPSDVAPPTPHDEPAGHGLIVSAEGDILTMADAVRGRERVPVELAGGTRLEAQVVAYDPDSDLVLLRAPAIPTSDAAPWAADPPSAGMLAMAVAHTAGRITAAPVFVSGTADAEARVRMTTANLVPGTPIYTIDGEVFAIASGGAPLASLVAPAVTRLRERMAAGQSRRGALGLIFQPLDAALQAHYGTGGVLVADVVPEGPASDGGVQPGDLITAIGGAAVASADEARHTIGTLAPGTSTEIRLLRSRKPLTMQLTASSALGLRALRWAERWSTDAPDARTLLDEATREAAGLLPQSRILSVAGRRVTTAAEGRTQLRRTRGPVLLYVEDERGRFFRLLERPE